MAEIFTAVLSCVYMEKRLQMKKYTRMIRRRIQLLFGREINIKPTINLPVEFHGTEYGGWAIRKDSLNAQSQVISVGVGEDASFDLSLISKYGCTVHAFDPTPKSAAWVHQNITDKNFVFEPYALADKDGYLKLFLPKNTEHVSASCQLSSHVSAEFFDAPCLRLSSLLKRLSFSRIDVLKIDIEGAEYAVINDVISSGSISSIDQLLVEFHHYFTGFSVRDTRDVISKLSKAGFDIAWVSAIGHEVLFVRS